MLRVVCEKGTEKRVYLFRDIVMAHLIKGDGATSRVYYKTASGTVGERWVGTNKTEIDSLIIQLKNSGKDYTFLETKNKNQVFIVRDKPDDVEVTDKRVDVGYGEWTMSILIENVGTANINKFIKKLEGTQG